jgi:hypothetical protein
MMYHRASLDEALGKEQHILSVHSHVCLHRASQKFFFFNYLLALKAGLHFYGFFFTITICIAILVLLWVANEIRECLKKLE